MSKHHAKPKSSHDPAIERVAALAAEVCAGAGVDLVAVSWAGSGVLRVTIERRQDGPLDLEHRGWGVTLDDCADVSRALSERLDQSDPIAQRYSLEVSSPGLDRELLSLDEFSRFVGLAAKAKLRKAAPDGQKVLRGTIERVEDEHVTMSLDPSGGGRASDPRRSITVPFADIAEANLVFELQKAEKRSHPKRSRS